MRLLNVQTRLLKEFPESERPPYAILSHTWGNNEISFSEIGLPDVQTKDGYAKIEYTLRQTAQQGLKYCWIDTCCIDKSSSAELSEAINSMFTWYSQAKVCYAYLDDVRSSSVDKDLPNARWFTRGWTLQELLAPRRVEFYGKGWAPLGFKDTESERITEFTHKLATITDIDELVLWKPACMRSKSVAARMSWASKRQTRRPEDIAYCLLGIFGVNMPLLYGEGDRAFIRLQEEIIKISEDHSIFAWDRDFGEARTASCLASSPSWFRRGAYVVPFGRKQSRSTPYAITNHGLQIELPLLPKSGSEIIFGLINCHWENDLGGCIGIPLRGTHDSQFFERSSRHRPETISHSGMLTAKKSTIFLSARPPDELPFAAEVNLQVYDSSLKTHGFSDLEIMNNPMASHHWHPEYENFRLRWLLSSQVTRVEVVGLLWTHTEHQELGLVICIQGRIDGLGRFKALNIGISCREESPDSWSDDFVAQFGNDQSIPRTNSDQSINAKCRVNLRRTGYGGKSGTNVTAQLRQQDIFGNEVYTLSIVAGG